MTERIVFTIGFIFYKIFFFKKIFLTLARPQNPLFSFISFIYYKLQYKIYINLNLYKDSFLHLPSSSFIFCHPRLPMGTQPPLHPQQQLRASRVAVH